MQTYARVVNGLVEEIIGPMTDEAGNEIPIAERFHPLIVAMLVNITETEPRPDQGWSYDGVKFIAPASS